MPNHEQHATGWSSNTLLEHASFVRMLARSVVAGRDESDDVVQEACLAALQRKRGVGAPHWRSWLQTVVRRRGLDLARRETTRRDHEAGANRPEEQHSPAALAARAEMGRKLVDAVLSLDSRYRDPILSRFYENRSIAEVAENLSIPVETVRTRLRRGIARLREILDDSTGSRNAWRTAFLALVGPVDARPKTVSIPAVLAWAGAVAAIVMGLGMFDFGDAPKEFLEVESAGLTSDFQDDPRRSAASPALRETPVAKDRESDHATPLSKKPLSGPTPLLANRAPRHALAPVSSSRTEPRLPGGNGQLTVLVIDSDGHSLVGADVMVFDILDEAPTEVRRRDLQSLGRTDAMGRLQISGLAHRRYAVTADWAMKLWNSRSRAFDTTASKTALLGETPASVTIRLPIRRADYVSLSGVVKDPGGRFLRGATITVQGLRARTDSQGEFELTGLEAGKGRYGIKRSGFEPIWRDITLRAESPRLNVELPWRFRGSRLLGGRVLDGNGTVVRGALVRLDWKFKGVVRMEWTDSDGRFTMTNIPEELFSQPCSATAWTVDGRFSTWKSEFAEGLPSERLRVNLGPRRIGITVRVRDHDSRDPVSACRIAFLTAGAEARGMLERSANGIYECTSARGAFQLRIEAPGYETIKSAIRIDEEGSEHNLTLRRRNEGSKRIPVELTIVDAATQRPLAGCRVRLDDGAELIDCGREQSEVRTLSVPIGSWRVTIDREGYDPHLVECVLDPDGGAAAATISMRPRVAGRFSNPKRPKPIRNR